MGKNKRGSRCVKSQLLFCWAFKCFPFINAIMLTIITAVINRMGPKLKNALARQLPVFYTYFGRFLALNATALTNHSLKNPFFQGHIVVSTKQLAFNQTSNTRGKALKRAYNIVTPMRNASTLNYCRKKGLHANAYT